VERLLLSTTTPVNLMIYGYDGFSGSAFLVFPTEGSGITWMSSITQGPLPALSIELFGFGWGNSGGARETSLNFIPGSCQRVLFTLLYVYLPRAGETE